MERKNAWAVYGKEDFAAAEETSLLYRHFLDHGKTERECVSQAVLMAEQQGYVSLEKKIRPKAVPLGPGDKVYVDHMGKAAAFFVIGKEPLEYGMNIVGAHVDSPRLDIKQIPLYEEAGQVYLDTQYYGGVKKYQWLALPMALHGVAVTKDGTVVKICIGEEPGDPVFVVTDLLPHLGKEKNEQKVKDFINAEKMDLLVGNRPENGKAAKEYVLQLLFEQYQIREEDFISAELEVVPAGGARECGIDRSMILGYGQDDRSCSFAALHALFGLDDVPERTACCLLVDKEEIGSRGATGMTSRFFENAVAEILELSWNMEVRPSGHGALHTGTPPVSAQVPGHRALEYQIPSCSVLACHSPELLLRRALQNSRMLSADVSAAYDPMFDSYFEKKNAAYLSNGLVFCKYSGGAGKSGGNDANAEFMAQLRRMMEENHVVYQTAELGAVDQGGGGTIAYIMAEYGMQVIDCGLPVLGMHAPWETVSKADLYEAVKGYRAFFQSRE